MHFWYCNDPEFTGVREYLLQTLDEQLETIQTSPSTRQTIIQCISYWVHAQEYYPILVNRYKQGQQDELSSAVHSQNKIGWEHFLKGRLSHKWLTLQDHYCKDEQLSPNHNNFTWDTNTIAQLIKMGLNLWDYQNKILRGFNYANSMLLKRNKITDKTKHSYQLSAKVKPHFQHVFTKPLPELFKHTISYLQSWQLSFNLVHTEWKQLQKNNPIPHNTDITITGKRRPPNDKDWYPQSTLTYLSLFYLYLYFYLTILSITYPLHLLP